MDTIRNSIDITIRPFAPTASDYAAIVAIHNAIFPEYATSEAELRHHDEHYAARQFVLHRYVAINATGRLVGRAQYHEMPGAADRFWFILQVDPEHQKRGIGSRLWEHALAELRQRGAQLIQGMVREYHTDAIAFAERRGCYEVGRAWESRINPQAFDPAPFQPYLDRAQTAGIVLTTLAEEKLHDSNWLRKAYDLQMALQADEPSPNPFTPLPLEDFVREEIDAPYALHDAYFLAKDGERWIGQSVLGQHIQGPFPLFQSLTGTLRAYRGRGIATALKLQALRYAKIHGFTMLKTFNDITNQPMLAINTKLGFVRQPAAMRMEKRLNRAE